MDREKELKIHDRELSIIDEQTQDLDKAILCALWKRFNAQEVLIDTMITESTEYYEAVALCLKLHKVIVEYLMLAGLSDLLCDTNLNELVFEYWD